MSDLQVIPSSRVTGLLTTAEACVLIPIGTRQLKLYVSTTARAGINTSATTAPTNTAEVQTITAGDATGGTAVYTFQGQNTAATAYDASAATFQTNFRAITSIGATGVSCSGGPLNVAPIVVTFDGTTLSGDQPIITVNGGSLTGGASALTRVPTIAETTKGVANRAKVRAGQEEVWTIPEFSTQSYLWLVADSGTGTYECSFYR